MAKSRPATISSYWTSPRNGRRLLTIMQNGNRPSPLIPSRRRPSTGRAGRAPCCHEPKKSPSNVFARFRSCGRDRMSLRRARRTPQNPPVPPVPPSDQRAEMVVVPPVLPQILLEAINADTLIATVNGDKLSATPIRRSDITQTLTELIARLGSPTRVEVRELDGSVHADILTAPAPQPRSAGSAPLHPRRTCRSRPANRFSALPDSRTPRHTPLLQLTSAPAVPG